MLKLVISRAITLCLALLASSGCFFKNTQPNFHTEGKPATLSEWNLFNFEKQTLTPHQNVTPYTLNTSLFSDYAHKFRTLSVPKNSIAHVNKEGAIEFPIGTIISKTFYYPKTANTSVSLNEQTDFPQSLDLKKYHLIETRLLVKRENAWVTFPYVWNNEQSEAHLDRFGYSVKLNGVDADGNKHRFDYNVPDVNQCAACHEWNKEHGVQPIGLQVRHLNGSRELEHKTVSQLELLATQHLLDLTRTPVPLAHKVNNSGLTINLDSRARAYLDINCAHCHNPQGPANTSGLHLEAFRPIGNEIGICKLPIAAGSGTGDRSFGIHPGNPDDSIFSYRLASNKPEKMMPELGRTLVHKEGVALINEWIKSLSGSCIMP